MSDGKIRILDADRREIFCGDLAELQAHGPISVGRSSAAVISLKNSDGADRTVGRIHFSLVQESGTWYAVDAGSSGISKDGQRQTKVALGEGDRLNFGNCILVFGEHSGSTGYWLVWENPNGKLEKAELFEGTNTVGTAPDNEICLSSRTCSARHALIRLNNGKCHIQDIGSSNGTYVNGKKIEAEAHLPVEGLFSLGYTPARIVSESHLKRYERQSNPFRPKRRRTPVIILLALALLGGFSFALLGPGSAEKREAEEPPGSMSVAAPAKSIDSFVAFMKSGNYGKAQRILSRSKWPESAHELLEAEQGAIDSLRDIGAKLTGNPIRRFLSKDSGLTVELLQRRHKYWGDAQQALKTSKKEVDSLWIDFKTALTENPYAYELSIPRERHYLKRYMARVAELRERVESLETLRRLGALTLAHEWQKVREFLESDAPSLDGLKRKDGQYFEPIRGLEDFVIRIVFAQTFVDDVRNRPVLDDAEKKLEKARAERETLDKLFAGVRGLFPKMEDAPPVPDLKPLARQLQFYIELKDLHAHWGSKKSDIARTEKLVDGLRDLTSDGNHAFLQRIIKDYSKELDEHFRVVVENSQIPENRTGVAQLEDLLKYGRAVAPVTNIRPALKQLESKQDEILRILREQCDRLYGEYRRAEDREDFDTMHDLLVQIRDTAMTDSRFYNWAQDELAEK